MERLPVIQAGRFTCSRSSLRLRPFIQCIWQLAGDFRSSHDAFELMHPEGGWGFIFNLTEASVMLNGLPYRSAVLVSGPGLQSVKFAVHGKADLVGIRFVRGMAAGISGQSMSALVGFYGAESDSELRLGTCQIAQQLALTTDSCERVALLETWAEALFYRASCPDARLVEKLRVLEQNQYLCSVNAVAKWSALGSRQLERYFRQWVGLTPKQFIRLQRIRTVRRMLNHRQPTTERLTDIAYASGYYDQAHFNRDFRQMVGMTPGEYLCRACERNAR
ncbi:helix-turn-helix domain-containing protein [Celerinatantimonas diazotrophica]|uniref:AraC family transcriptional regulator n=1 Tax=Celerinatantimonas diazotrophica TaxID=412034 RepID=A0A4R1K4B0_9GAMM|nr:helix-turn-helix domain-containing protein [Celerinatantimonas diazotrophica]TCK58965.1 AraC family transcriptional regulator [Celerinatantimonas diazotrophica]CAG9297600.1 HTH-type transcriptional activator RhaS [Celerinatantimonas diazotrophica]